LEAKTTLEELCRMMVEANPARVAYKLSRGLNAPPRQVLIASSG
jgi:hypothetical protein